MAISRSVGVCVCVCVDQGTLATLMLSEDVYQWWHDDAAGTETCLAGFAGLTAASRFSGPERLVHMTVNEGYLESE